MKLLQELFAQGLLSEEKLNDFKKVGFIFEFLH